MDTTKIINSGALSRMVIWLGKNLPPRLGYAVSDSLSDLISHRPGWKQPRATRSNQWVVCDGKVTPKDLTRRVYETYRISGRGYYDFYHLMNDPKQILEKMQFSPAFEEILHRSTTRKEGMILALSSHRQLRSGWTGGRVAGDAAFCHHSAGGVRQLFTG